ncbi:MAG: dihydrodipicolinate synthase family protein [Burkholderiales bacterium]
MYFQHAVIAPNLTPFNEDFTPDTALYVTHARRLLDEGCAALAPFGTTGEAASLGMAERMALLEALVSGGIEPARLVPGTGLTALPDSVTLCRHALELGVHGTMLLPPFYYKDVGDDALHAWFARLIEGVGRPEMRIYLYHIPPVARVGFSIPLVKRLAADFPGIVVGIKDSGGDWENTAALLGEVPGLTVFPGNELKLVRAIRSGAAGCITATANVNAAAISLHAGTVDAPEALEREAQVDRFRETLQRHRPIPAMKAMLARRDAHSGWMRVRPPLESLSTQALRLLEQDLEAVANTGGDFTNSRHARS